MVSHIQPRNGYYTATEAAILLGMNRVRFAKFVKSDDPDAKELVARRVQNTSDRRGILYPADVIDRLKAHAVPTERRRVTDLRNHPQFEEIMAWISEDPTRTNVAMVQRFGISFHTVDRFRAYWSEQREDARK